MVSATGYRLAIGTGAWGWSVASAAGLDGSKVPWATKNNRTSSRVREFSEHLGVVSASTTQTWASSRPAALGSEPNRLSEAMIACGGGRVGASLQKDFDSVFDPIDSKTIRT
jgi:hypothetical protein